MDKKVSGSKPQVITLQPSSELQQERSKLSSDKPNRSSLGGALSHGEDKVDQKTATTNDTTSRFNAPSIQARSTTGTALGPLEGAPAWGSSAEARSAGSATMEKDTYKEWCIDRAMAYARDGDFSRAISSFLSDTGKHSGTKHTINDSLSFIILQHFARTPQEFEKAMRGFAW